MKIRSLLLLLLVCCFLGGSTAAQKKTGVNDLRSMVETERAFARMSEENGTREAFTAFIADEGIRCRRQRRVPCLPGNPSSPSFPVPEISGTQPGPGNTRRTSKTLSQLPSATS